MPAYYNEIDPFAAQWLRTLINKGHLPRGDVDERSIADVKPDDLRSYGQCHFFAGIGVWAHALRLAKWDDDRPVWTGSCPCQPFSAAGKGAGFADERHLWPAWFHLIEHAKPRNVPVFGEQVASKDGLAWLDLVHADMEGTGHTVRAVDLCAAGVGAPHIRQRLWFVADSESQRRRGWTSDTARTRRRYSTEVSCPSGELAHTSRDRRQHGAALTGGYGARVESAEPRRESCAYGLNGVMGDAVGPRLERQCGDGGESKESRRIGTRSTRHATETIPVGGMANTDHSERRTEGPLRNDLDRETPGRNQSYGDAPKCLGFSGLADSNGGNASTGRVQRSREYGQREENSSPLRGGDSGIGHNSAAAMDRPGPTSGHWRDADWLFCRDGKWRPVEPGTFPLAHGATARMGRLRGYGNAINAEAAKTFIEAYDGVGA